MRTFGKITIPEQGLRFVPSELLESVEYTLLGLAIWALVASFAATVIKKRELNSRWPIVGTALAALLPLWIAALAFLKIYTLGIVNPRRAWSSIVLPVTQSVFPTGIFFLVLFFMAYALWKLAKTPGDDGSLQETGLGIYASLIAFRQMMELRPSLWDCAVFFNGAAFLVFVILLSRIIRWGCRSLDIRRTEVVASTMLGAEAVLACLLFFPRPQILTTRLTTDAGSFYTRSDVATLFPQIISFMKTHTRNGKDILVVPEPPSLYVFAGMEAPSRWYSLVPGYVAPDQEQQYIADLASNHVRYVLIANRILTEYNVHGFANGGYNVPIYNWIMANYVKVGQFGPTPDAPHPVFIMWIYERKDLQNEK